ncbi:MAG: hypothetical protein ACLUKN_06095 [Bacilli bacterium]
MYVAAFEPFGCAEFAYVFAVPAILVPFLVRSKRGFKPSCEQNRPNTSTTNTRAKLRNTGCPPCIACAYEI